MTAPSLRVVAADVTVDWDGGTRFAERGTLVLIAPGSAMETAYGGAPNTPAASSVQVQAANGGVASFFSFSN
jgi:hypothetical protein